MYADDTSIYRCSKDMPQLNKEINEDLEKLDEWLIGNKLSLNVAKTHSMLIASQQKHKSLSRSDIRFEPKIRGKEIEIRCKAKYLGVQIDDHLNWKEHTKAVSAKVSRAVGFLKYSKRYLPITAVKTLYTSIVGPHFQYCCSVWGCCSAAEIQHLQRLQNRAARIVTNSCYDATIKHMFESLGWKTIQQLINTQSKIVTFKSLNNLTPEYLCEFFTKNSACSSRNLRNTNADVRLPKKKQCKGKKPFPFEVPRYGTASLMRPNWHPHCTNLKNIWVHEISWMIWGLPFGGPLGRLGAPLPKKDQHLFPFLFRTFCKYCIL